MPLELPTELRTAAGRVYDRSQLEAYLDAVDEECARRQVAIGRAEERLAATRQTGHDEMGDAIRRVRDVLAEQREAYLRSARAIERAAVDEAGRIVDGARVEADAIREVAERIGAASRPGVVVDRLDHGADVGAAPGIGERS
ncbi:MAG: hypothetical protein AB7H43_05140 [Acidimicrobiia bacterium]